MHDIAIVERILAKNDAIALENRRLLRARGIFAINMVSSPGSGKTSVIERMAVHLSKRVGLAVIEGDMETDLDARRIERLGIPVRQITTGRSCHLDAHMISHVLPWVLEQKNVRLLIIENVGNMVCPAEYDLGEEMKVAVMSVTEGDDKPLKYPALFHASKALLLNKTDLLGHVNFNMQEAESRAMRVNPRLAVFRTSCASGEGIGKWCDYLLRMADGIHDDPHTD